MLGEMGPASRREVSLSLVTWPVMLQLIPSHSQKWREEFHEERVSTGYVRRDLKWRRASWSVEVVVVSEE